MSYLGTSLNQVVYASVRDLRSTRYARRRLSSTCNLSRLCDQLHIGLLTKAFIRLFV